uniref:Type II/III secretion system secretin-like domain-containing protein n=1 Tax=candidate division WOR-3 bacterium TaxID=2052148 RepID=A0A7V3ZWC9_UNCW3
MNRFILFLGLLISSSFVFTEEPSIPKIEIDHMKASLLKKISIQGKSIPISSIMELVSEETGFGYYLDAGLSNLVITDLNFRDATIKELLDFLETNYDLVYRIEGNKIFLKNYDTWTFEISFPARSNKSSITIGGSVIPTGELTGGAQIRSEFSGGQSDLYTAIESDVKALLSPAGKFSLNRNSGTLLVSDSASALKRVKHYIDKVRESKDRKVRIEVKIVEVSLDNTNSYGIDWSFVKNFSANSTSFSLKLDQSTALTQQVFSIDLKGGGFTTLLNFLSTYGKVNLLSQPSILLMNGESALLSVGRLLTYWELTAQAAGAQVGTPVVYPVQKNILKGLLFSVTPFISSDSSVTMEITPVLADVSKWETYQWQGQILEAPSVDIREAHTMLKVRSGETIILGGLISNKENKVERGIPILSKIPVIGSIFKKEEKVAERTELVIFITPQIE